MFPSSAPEASCRQFSLSDIKSATNNFSSNLIMGKGSFGNVYRARIATGTGTETFVAVKRRDSDSKQGSKEFWTEVNLLSAVRHTHVISLIGYCVDSDSETDEMILVYEYMANGTLADHIYKRIGNSSFLSWEQRLKICIGVGSGLEYLHTGTGINQIVIHRDIKSANILLDDDFEPRISDFGLCERCNSHEPDTAISASLKGTRGYIDPHYRKTHELSTKADVYSFGVVLLEVLCGKRPLDFVVVGRRQERLVSWAQQCIREGVAHRIIDRGLRGRIADDGLKIFQEITLQCLQERPDKRPTMVEVVAKLKAALNSQYSTYSSSSSSEGDEFIRIYFGQVANTSSSANSDADSLRRPETGSGKSDAVKQDPDFEASTTIVRKRHKSSSSIKYNGLDVPADLHSDQAAPETSNSLSEYDKLVKRMNPPSVVVDNESCEDATVIEVNGTSTPGVLLELLQVLTDFDLKVTKSSRTNDGSWFMDVFYVIDPEGNKVTDVVKLQNIQKALRVYSSSTSPMGRKCEERPIPAGHTTIKLIGNDRPGLISELSAILGDLQCNVFFGAISIKAPMKNKIPEGLKIEIRTKDRVGLLSDVTRIMRENSLNITRAEVATTGDKAVFSFYLDDNLGYPVDPNIIDYVRKEIGQNILQVKGNRKDSYQIVEESITRSSFKDVLKTFLSWMRFSYKLDL